MSAAVTIEGPSTTRSTSQSTWSAVDLLNADFPEPRWAVPGLIAEGLTLFVGSPKVGKSWAALNIAVAIATGNKVFSQIPVEPGAVLYLALEDTPRRLQTRLRKVLGEESDPGDLTLMTRCPPFTNLGEAAIKRWIDKHPDARLIVVDVLARMREDAGTAGSAYERDYAAMAQFKLLADTYGIAVLVIHHTRKMGSDDPLDTVSGTNGLAGAADAVLVLERPRGEADGVLKVTGRDIEEREYPLKFDATAGAWSMLAGSAAEYAMSPSRRDAFKVVKKLGTCTPAQLAAEAGVQPTTARQTLKRMLDDGQLVSGVRGHYSLPPVSDPSPVTSVTLSLGSEGDSGDGCDTPQLGLAISAEVSPS